VIAAAAFREEFRFQARIGRVGPLVTCALILVLHSSAKAGQSDLRSLDGALTALAERIAPAVVHVVSDAYTPLTDAPGSPTAYEQTTGSGIIFSPEGHVVTNAHVVKGATRIQVVLANRDSRPARSSIVRPRGEVRPARLLGVDRETDIAVLQIEPRRGEPAGARPWAHVALGDSDTVRQGQIVVAFGSPFGLQNSMSMGIVSAIARQLKDDDPMIYIQSDVSINPGNSSGPMADVEGNIIGVNTMIISESGGSEGVGLAVPSNIVRTVTAEILKHGVMRRGEIGVEPQTITETLVSSLKLSRTWGVILGDVLPDGPAEKAGLKVGDIVLTLDGKPMENARQLQVNLYTRAVDSMVEIGVLRDSAPLKFRVTVAERPNDSDRFAAMVNRDVAAVRALGILGLEITPAVRELVPDSRFSRGILVANLMGSAGRPAGLMDVGDIIYSVNGQAVTTLDELKRVLKPFEAGDAVVLQVERDGKLRYVEVTLD
jgi:serine protease Do